ncbi:DUF6493 family protein [Streptomyces naphthomycinicus]|uniref:DUF7824 domain-containing protein n=1 Tax=Streptomyces naphthomycinicus TaxID=2872625 RepID=UPI001CEE05D1|nr:DUF6493 family protein [Streptomyces sp. TML10]
MTALMEAVRAGDTAKTLRLVTAMTTGERRAAVDGLKALRKELRGVPWWERRSERILPALHLAGAACHTGAAAAAAWLAASDLRWSQAPADTLLRALEARDPGWLADVAHRLAQRPASARVPFELMAGLVGRAGCEVPVTDAYVIGWVRYVGDARHRREGVVDVLRREPHLAALVGGLFALSDVSEVHWLLGEGQGPWPRALAALAREGVLDRASLAGLCVARLLRGGGPTDHRVFLPFLTELALTREEERARVPDWTALARDAVSPVASHAQSVLTALALAGELTARQLTEASEGLLFRREKKLVRAQLVLLGKVLSHGTAAAAELLPVLAQAFGHEDTQVQERALKLVERHAGGLGSAAARDTLVGAAERLAPALRPRAAAALGVASIGSEEVFEEVLPPVPEPVRLDAAPRTAEELAEELGALLASDGDVGTFERALDGLVRHAYQDPDALREALVPVVGARWWGADASREWPRTDDMFGNGRYGTLDAQNGLDLLLATLHGRVATATLHAAVRQGPKEHECAHSALARVFDARLREVAYRLRTEPLPLLLATPTWSTGLLEPADLVARLAEYRRLDARAGAADFAQALLRVRRDDRAAAEEAAVRARTLGTREGVRLARWLTTDNPTPGSRLASWLRTGTAAPDPARRRTKGARILVEPGEIPELRAGFPQEFRLLGRPLSVVSDRWHCTHWDDAIRPHWLAVLPERRELVAARMLPDLAGTAVGEDRGAAVLPLLAEAGGEAGEAVHLCVAYGLGARHQEDRLAAVDALLVLAARGQLDMVRLGTDLGELVGRGAVKPQRLAESARTAAETGAHATTWEILRYALPVPLAGLVSARPQEAAVAARSLGELLAVAAECAERSGARGDVPHLAETAARSGSSRLVVQARRLRDALGAEVAA